mmetsp:Transcript_4257/g.9637  ORF Transcript_4257/g.9637 Transcript_4257/m.9637 type:complete len:404 (-) Transcript_4257:239-1450(-)|eukprot:CAMPEP_0178495768 /NCGR_PEP_ID=MMETSP0696-20121128/13728_1 /TAXON_ID=265572 /ORGANISM="Extubocellulus spinifer, Strain CCMP396" /LENGTH=403 /DNA_ID=CAMNT_0020123943 /DNA_START=131 /DNA_END=1342 /DNA_ORIENTATION=-
MTVADLSGDGPSGTSVVVDGEIPGQFSSLDHEDFENEAAAAGHNFNDDRSSTTSSQLNQQRQPHPQQVQANRRHRGREGGGRGGIRRGINRLRRRCGAVVNDNRCQIFIVLLIVINAIMMGIGTFDFVTDNPHLNEAFEKVDQAFLIIFTVELGMQFIYRGLNLFRDGWLVFDFVIIVFSWAFASIQIIRAFRIFRAFRLVTRIETLRKLVGSLFAVFPNLSAIGCLLLLLFYIFAVMFTTLYSDLELSDNYFSSLDASLFTLFQYMTMEWSEVTREVMTYQSWAWLPSLVFVAISGFIVFNLIIAVICDAVAIIEQEKNDDEADGIGSAVINGGPGVHLDESSQKRIFELNRQMVSLVQTQRNMQLQIEHLARVLELPPTDDSVNGDDDSLTLPELQHTPEK